MKMMLMELYFFTFFLIILPSKQILVTAIAGRCYLCSQANLAECAGSAKVDSSIYHTVLQYYTEPCNGQCVLFRNIDHSITRGCSWTYGHMTPKSIGWHEITPGIMAYFCDTHLCNNGTYEQTETPTNNNQLLLSSHELFVLAGSNPLLMQPGQYLPHQLHQCYSCTARYQGCGESLDPHYASNYIRPCPSSCIIFRNPNDLNLITRDCSIFWPQVQAKSGLHKLLGADAFFCQESLCNGINFDFIMGIFHNQIPLVIKGTPGKEFLITTAKTKIATSQRKTTLDIYNDNTIWDDADLDFAPLESVTRTIQKHPTTTTFKNSTDSIDKTYRSSSTIVSHRTTVITTSKNLNSTSTRSPLISSTLILPILDMDDDDLILSNTTSIPSITRFQYLKAKDEDDDDDTDDTSDEADEIDAQLYTVRTNLNPDAPPHRNDYGLSSLLTTTSIPDFMSNDTQSFFSYYFNNKTKSQLLEYIKPLSPLSVPPFEWMLNMATRNKSKFSSSKPTTKKPNAQTTTTKIPSKSSEIFYEYCENKQCQYDGRLNSDCLCICLPAFTGDYCETVLCDQEPVHICAFVLEHECETDHIRYLCPKYCRMDSCASADV